MHPTRGVRRHNRVWFPERTAMKTILNRLRKLENGHLAPVETETGRRAREANERLRQRMAEGDARLKAMGYEMPKMSEAERVELSGLSLGQAIRRRFERHVAKSKETAGQNKVDAALGDALRA